MKQFTKQFIFILLAGVVITSGVLAIRANGNLKVNPILGHDLDLNALYYGQAASSAIHQITTEDISISAWVKVDVDASNYGYVLSKYSSGIGWLFWITDTGKIGARIYQDVTHLYFLAGNTDIRDNKWHYISVIIDRDTAGSCKLFLDGVDNTASRTGTLSDVATVTNTRTMYLGTQEGNFKLDGQIRDVKLYYAAGDHWSDAQVLYQAQHPFDYSANAGTLTDYWRLDEGSGTTLYGKVNNLTLSNALAWTTQPKIKMVKQENATTTSNNPVGWWKMDEGTAIHGSSVADSSGNGNVGTLSTGDGATNKSVAGKLGKGLSFDGVNDYVDMGAPSSFNFVNAFTAGMWVKPSGTQSFGNYSPSLMGNYNTAVGNSGFVIRNANGVSNQIGVNVTTAAGIKSVNIPYTPTNQWVYFVLVFNGTSVNMYKNGVYAGTSGTFSATIYDYTPANTFYLGKTYNDNGYFNGLIDDIRIYNRALSAGEVGQMYNSTKDGYLGNIKVSTGLVGYWKLDDNNALTTTIDYSGKGNTGTAYSGTATSTSVLSTSTAMIGRAFSFDGGDDYVDVGDKDIFTFGNGVKDSPFSVCSWINPGELTTTKSIVSKYYGVTGVYEWSFIVADNYIRLLLADYIHLPCVPYADSPAGSVTSGWHYVCATYNGRGGATAMNGVTLYVDGISQTLTKNNLACYVAMSNTITPVYIGARYNPGSTYQYFNGLIDEVKIWNYARSAEQIKNDYVLGTLHREE